MKNIRIKIKTLAHYHGLELPAYQTAGASGMDLLAAVPEDGLLLAKGKHRIVPTGISMQLPVGYEAQVRPRSGLAVKYGLTVLNSPGTIDADYRGELRVILINHGEDDFLIERGMRIAQLVIAPVCQADWQLCPNLEQSQRGDGGFGHSGI